MSTESAANVLVKQYVRQCNLMHGVAAGYYDKIMHMVSKGCELAVSSTTSPDKNTTKITFTLTKTDMTKLVEQGLQSNAENPVQGSAVQQG